MTRAPRRLREFAESMKVNYPILIGKESVGDDYGGVQFLPETFYIDRNGKVVDKAFGLKGRGEIEDDIKKILGPSSVAQTQQIEIEPDDQNRASAFAFFLGARGAGFAGEENAVGYVVSAAGRYRDSRPGH